MIARYISLHLQYYDLLYRVSTETEHERHIVMMITLYVTS